MGQPKDSEFKDRDTMTLDLDDGGKLECIVLNVFPVNNREYIALLPMNDEGHVEEDAQIFLYRFEELGDDEVNLETIEDDDEFELVSDYFDEMLDEQEFNELFTARQFSEFSMEASSMNGRVNVLSISR